jgi:hypothetical protein
VGCIRLGEEDTLPLSTPLVVSAAKRESEQEFLPHTVCKTVDLAMSYAQDSGSSRGKQPADCYFSRQIVPHISWTGDLITVDSNEHGDTNVDHEGRSRSQEPLSPVESDLLTPATLTPPVEHTETSPLLQAHSNPTTAYASTDMPVVCCRAGPRPANVSSDNHGYSAAPFQNRPPESMTQSIFYRRTGQDLEQNKLPSFRRQRHRRQSSRCCESKYVHRWVLALSLMGALFFLQHLFLSEDATEASCTLPYCSNSLTHSFDNISTFSLSEDLQIPGLSIRGAIHLEPAPENQDSQVVVVASYAASRNWRASPQWELSDNAIRLQAPTLVKQGKSFLPRMFNPCLSIGATIYLHANTSLQTFQVDTTYLSITSSPNLFPRSPSSKANQRGEERHPHIDLTTLLTTAHPITLPNWISRRTILQTTSSAIAGTFTHRDLISLTSLSGSIAATIIPDEADPSKPLPALLKIETVSGSVRVTYPSIDTPSTSSSSASTLPARDYETHIQTASGSIAGSFLFTSSGDLSAVSGSVLAQVLYAPLSNPQGGEKPVNQLKTSSRSGATDIQVSWVGKGQWKDASLHGVHGVVGDGASGSVRVRYPAEWEGEIEAESSGSVRVVGEGVVVDGEERVGGRTAMKAHRGQHGGGSVVARAGSGSVDVSVGGWWQ